MIFKNLPHAFTILFKINFSKYFKRIQNIYVIYPNFGAQLEHKCEIQNLKHNFMCKTHLNV